MKTPTRYQFFRPGLMASLGLITAGKATGQILTTRRRFAVEVYGTLALAAPKIYKGFDVPATPGGDLTDCRLQECLPHDMTR